MSTAALFIIAQSPQVIRQTQVHILKDGEVLMHVTTWVHLENTVLTEKVSHRRYAGITPFI